MLSYRHGYHAGNYADVLKHSILLQVLKLMHKKDKPMVYIDTHAGAGGYSLSHPFSEKTGEYLDGVARLWSRSDLPQALRDYVDAIKRWGQGQEELRQYPGSPSFVNLHLRENDRMVLHELHGTDHELLEECFDGHRQVKVIKGNGLKGLIAAVPPLERRGVILIDPSYEIKSDYEDVVNAIVKAHKRFSHGVFLLWYPLVTRALTESMLQRLFKSGIRRQLRIEQSVQADNNEFGMTGAGLIVINPPWKLDDMATQMLSYLGPILGQSAEEHVVKWEVGE
jgi:23S rRNA (adenine2030-N6)-methyltransferase